MIKESIRRRFDVLIERTDGCWRWKGKKDRDGYGVFYASMFGQRHNRASRVSWVIQNNSAIPKDRCVMHWCDNPECTRPDHLKLGTHAENVQDMMTKGRHRALKGEDVSRAAITEEQAKAILSDTRPYAVIGEDYGIAASTVGSIKNSVSWKHLKGERKRPVRVSPRRGVSQNITPAIVHEIRASIEPYSKLAGKHGVTVQTICDIRKRRSWKHIS